MSDEQTNDDELFAHLQDLMARLPDMQALSARVARAQAAQEVLERDHQHAIDESMYTMANQELAKARAALDHAQAMGASQQVIEDAEREVLYLANQRGLRVGPRETSQAMLEKALQKGGFASVDEARQIAAAMTKDQISAAQTAIADYQADYQATLARCQALEASDQK